METLSSLLYTMSLSFLIRIMQASNAAIAMMMKLEGIVLDTCYTGKAFAGLVRRAREGFYKPEDNVLFVHTGGAGGLFAQEWK